MSQDLPEDYERADRLEPAELREGEQTDDDAHARRNAEMIRMIRKQEEADDA